MINRTDNNTINHKDNKAYKIDFLSEFEIYRNLVRGKGNEIIERANSGDYEKIVTVNHYKNAKAGSIDDREILQRILEAVKFYAKQARKQYLKLSI